jgi:alkylhydroperoxidase family enzyme
VSVVNAASHAEPLESHEKLRAAGFRFGDKGTHTSRTIMLAELTDLLAAVSQGADRDAYAKAIVDENVLGKSTIATRRLTYQRLRELYALDPRLPLFRVLRRLWAADAAGRPLLAIFSTLARDPLLRATAPTVLALPVGTELVRALLLDALRDAVGKRLNESVLDKVARNAGSSWCQSGHLEGRVRKMRRRVVPTPGPLALALWLGTLEGLAGRSLLESSWARVLDRTGDALLPVALQAKQLGLIHARVGGGVVEIDATRLDMAVRS